MKKVDEKWDIMQLKNPFAVRKTDGQIVMISDLPPEQRGKACSCICPECKTEFIARMGDIRVPHFAHSGNACDVVKGFINSLYLFMWESLQENARFYLPECYGFFQESTGKEWLSAMPCNGYKRIIKACDFEVESSEIQKNTQDVADALIITTRKDHSLAVVLVPPATICKTFCPKPIEGFATIAIRMPQDLNLKTSSELKHILLQETQNKEWLSSPKIDKWRQKCQEVRAQRIRQQRNRQVRIDEIKRNTDQWIQNCLEAPPPKQPVQVKEMDHQIEEVTRQMVEILREYRASQPEVWDYNNDEELSAVRFHLSRKYQIIPNNLIVKAPNSERWCFCTSCKKWYLSNDMLQYGGKDWNLGLCRECVRKK